ncbi:MAG: hypothetical protein K0R62_3833 [Nonomuraea muscovyensis]|jgi:hypothetical protein|nr:hypothetical protein [Nonomuraea muscovyensis]
MSGGAPQDAELGTGAPDVAPAGGISSGAGVSPAWMPVAELGRMTLETCWMAPSAWREAVKRARKVD